MANTFITPTDVVRDASLVLADSLVVANLVPRSIESRFARKVGDTVTVKVPPNFGTADEFSSTTSASNLTETSVDVVLQKHFYKRVDLTSDELTMSLDDFNTVVTIPAVNSLIRSVEDFLIQKIVGGFGRTLSGTAGTAPSTHAHILAARKAIKDNRGDISNLIGILSSTAEASFAALNIFTSVDYGADRPMGLANASLGRCAGINFVSPLDAGTWDLGDEAGTVLVDGDPGTTTTIHVDGFTSATGTIFRGTRFTVAGDTSSTTYIVTADATIASNEVDLVVHTAADASIADGAAVTFVTAYDEDVVFNPKAVAAAIIPGAIIGPNVAAASINGLGVRVISDVSTSTLAGTWVFDLYAGAEVTQYQHGAVMQG